MEDNIEAYLGLLEAPSHKIIRRFKKHSSLFSIEDLKQEGYLGLLESYKKYDKNLNDNFSSYATKIIYGRMFDFVRKCLHCRHSTNIKFIPFSSTQNAYLIFTEDKSFFKRHKYKKNYSFYDLESEDEFQLLIKNLNGFSKYIIEMVYKNGYTIKELSDKTGLDSSFISSNINESFNEIKTGRDTVDSWINNYSKYILFMTLYGHVPSMSKGNFEYLWFKKENKKFINKKITGPKRRKFFKLLKIRESVKNKFSKTKLLYGSNI